MISHKIRLFLAWIAVFLFAQRAFAFPEMVRYGYTNCVTCHVSPTGGGNLTPYGRELSKEVLSTWGGQNENESKFAYGVVTPPNWIDAMGLYQSLYAYQNTPYISQGLFIYMEGDGEVAVHLGPKWTIDASLGYENKQNDNTVFDHLISRRNYVNFRPTEELSFRAGRFYPAFGIYTPNHFVPIKRDLGWDEGQETYNLEAAYLGERINAYVTADLGRPDSPSLNRETGFSFVPSYAIGDPATYKVGLTYFYGNGQSTSRGVVGPWAILGFTQHFYLLSEIDFQNQNDKAGILGSQWGAVDYQKLDYEVMQGLHLFLAQDYSRLSFADVTTLHDSFGGGVQFYPRPHFEFDLEYQKLQTAAISSDYGDFAYFLVNFYL